MFARPIFGNPFQPFNLGFTSPIGQYGQLPTTHLANPLIEAQLAAVNPFLQSQIGGYGVNPLALTMSGANPFLPQQFVPSLFPAINPLQASHLAAMYSPALTGLASQNWGGAQAGQSQLGPFGQLGAFGVHPQLGPVNSMISPFQHPIGSEVGHFGYTPFGIQQGWQNLGSVGNPNTFGQIPLNTPQQAISANPLSAYLGQDPAIGTSFSQQRLPIRPLVNPQQVDPFQSGIAALSGMGGYALTDPYLALNQAYLAQCGVSPLQQIGRGYTSNWTGSPYSSGQISPLAQAYAPFNV